MEGNTTKQAMKIHTVTAGLLCAASLIFSACVMRSSYDNAVADREAVKIELDSTRVQSQMLTEQVDALEQRKVDLATQMEATSSEVLRTTQQMKAEHAALQERLSKLNRAISQLIAQRKWLRYALQRANEERPVLESIVEKYKSKLSEADGTGAAQLPPSIDSTNRGTETPLVQPPQVENQRAPRSQAVQ